MASEAGAEPIRNRGFRTEAPFKWLARWQIPRAPGEPPETYDKIALSVRRTPEYVGEKAREVRRRIGITPRRHG